LFIDEGTLTSSYLLVGTYNVNDPGYTDTINVSDLIAGRTYRFVSTAFNQIGQSKSSIEVRFASASLPAVPASLKRGASTTQNQIHITWDIEPDTEILITGYVLEMYKSSCDCFVVIWNGKVHPETTDYIQTADIVTGQFYTFRHKAFNFNGESAYS